MANNINFPLTFSLAPFPTGSGLSADEYGQQLVANLQAFISGNFLTGQIGGTQPTQNIGPWLNGNIWWFWNPVLHMYAPTPVQPLYSSIHNGLMQVWQRNITFTAITGSIYTADRYVAATGLITGVATVSRHAFNLLGTNTHPDTAYSLRIAVTTAQTTITASEFFEIYQLVERVNARPLFDGATSLSLVLQASVAGTYCVAIKDLGTDWSYVMECVVTAPAVAQYFTFPSIPAFPTATGNWGTAETDACYGISVVAACGTTFQNAANIWSIGNFISTSNQTNLFATIGNTLDITLIQHEPGITCNPFIFTPFAQDLQKCQRYYNQSFDYGHFPNVAENTIAAGSITYSSISGFGMGYTRYPQEMRASPSFPGTLTIFNAFDGFGGFVYDNAVGFDRTVTSVQSNGKSGFSIIGATSLTAGNAAVFQYTASADL